MEITKALIQDVAYEAGLEPEDDVRTDYSGRNMYGDSCLGIVGDIGTLIRFCMSVPDFAVRRYEDDAPERVVLEELALQLDRVRQDSMGLSTVYYWPYIQVVD